MATVNLLPGEAERTLHTMAWRWIERGRLLRLARTDESSQYAFQQERRILFENMPAAVQAYCREMECKSIKYEDAFMGSPKADLWPTDWPDVLRRPE